MRLEDTERVGPAAREGRTQVGRVHHRLVWGGVGSTLGLRRPSVTFTRVKACWDGVHSRREMETVGIHMASLEAEKLGGSWKGVHGKRSVFFEGRTGLGFIC